MRTQLVTSAVMLPVFTLFMSAIARSDPPEPRQDDLRAAAALHGAAATSPDHAGIWKSVIPPAGSTRGEFNDYDPLGLSAGERIKADCSINWVDPDSGKRYCFSTATSLVSFLVAPHQYLSAARGFWNRLEAAPAR